MRTSDELKGEATRLFNTLTAALKEHDELRSWDVKEILSPESHQRQRLLDLTVSIIPDLFRQWENAYAAVEKHEGEIARAVSAPICGSLCPA